MSPKHSQGLKPHAHQYYESDTKYIRLNDDETEVLYIGKYMICGKEKVIDIGYRYSKKRKKRVKKYGKGKEE